MRNNYKELSMEYVERINESGYCMWKVTAYRHYSHIEVKFSDEIIKTEKDSTHKIQFINWYETYLYLRGYSNGLYGHIDF